MVVAMLVAGQLVPPPAPALAQDDEEPIADPGGPYFGVVGVPVTFDGTGSFDPDGDPIEEYFWDFDDGGDATGAIVTHTFSEPRTYEISLTVLANEEESEEAETVATIAPAPNVPPDATIDRPASNETIQAGQTVTFEGTATDPDGTIVSRIWSFPGGTPSGSTAEDPGNVRFDAVGTHDVTFTVTDDDGASDQDTRRITVVPAGGVPPTAFIDAPPPGASVEANQPVAFDGRGGDPDGGTVTFLWTFPGGTPDSSSDEDETVSFATPGPRDVTLRVTDDEGSSTSVLRRITVTPAGGGGSPPTATITSPDRNVTIFAGGSVSFAGDGGDPDGGPVTFAWEFEGGVPASSAERIPGNVTFPNPGGFSVTLTVRDDEGATAQAQRSVFVAAANQPPQAAITLPFENRVIAPEESVSFAGSASDPDGSIASYAWVFPGGDPSSSDDEDPGDVRFDSIGVYQVQLRATDDDGATSPPATRTVTVSGGVDPADLNVDRASPGSAERVDGHDVIFVLRAIETQDLAGDVNEDGLVDDVDVQLVISALGEVQ